MRYPGDRESRENGYRNPSLTSRQNVDEPQQQEWIDCCFGIAMCAQEPSNARRLRFGHLGTVACTVLWVDCYAAACADRSAGNPEHQKIETQNEASDGVGAEGRINGS